MPVFLFFLMIPLKIFFRKKKKKNLNFTILHFMQILLINIIKIIFTLFF